jgi:hypothetical protein
MTGSKVRVLVWRLACGVAVDLLLVMGFVCWILMWDVSESVGWKGSFGHDGRGTGDCGAFDLESNSHSFVLEQQSWEGCSRTARNLED